MMLSKRRHCAGRMFFEHSTGWRHGCRHILMLVVFARPTWRVAVGGQSDVEVVVHSTSMGMTYGTAAGSLDTLRAHWLRERLHTGLDLLGFTSFEDLA